MSRPKSIQLFFAELETMIRKMEAEVHDKIADQLEFYCSDKELLAAVGNRRQSLALVVSEIVRNELMSFSLSLMASLDGATSLAEQVHLTVTDQDGNEWPDFLHSMLMDYLVDRGLQ